VEAIRDVYGAQPQASSDWQSKFFQKKAATQAEDAQVQPEPQPEQWKHWSSPWPASAPPAAAQAPAPAPVDDATIDPPPFVFDPNKSLEERVGDILAIIDVDGDGFLSETESVQVSRFLDIKLESRSKMELATIMIKHGEELSENTSVTKLERIEGAVGLRPAPPPSEAAILSAARVIYASTVPSALRLTDEELAPIVAKNEHLRRKAAQHASVQGLGTYTPLQPANDDDWQRRVLAASGSSEKSAGDAQSGWDQRIRLASLHQNYKQMPQSTYTPNKEMTLEELKEALVEGKKAYEMQLGGPMGIPDDQLLTVAQNDPTVRDFLCHAAESAAEHRRVFGDIGYDDPTMGVASADSNKRLAELVAQWGEKERSAGLTQVPDVILKAKLRQNPEATG